MSSCSNTPAEHHNFNQHRGQAGLHQLRLLEINIWSTESLLERQAQVPFNIHTSCRRDHQFSIMLPYTPLAIKTACVNIISWAST
mmetsp:Transcript_17616/g.46119  ORF Transcript_17616/g.46119 Transcript_17616/m.46119 type:complete len:85 (+) Transcript_17616:302-556(+)